MRGALETLFRLRLPILLTGAVVGGFGTLLRTWVPAGPVDDALRIAVRLALALLALWLLVVLLGRRTLVEREGQAVHSPVVGRWLAVNSPASKVPSHGTRGYGQAYAVDLVHEPDGVERPGWGNPAMRAPEEYPAFGQPVLAMVDGVVVSASGWRRDHRSRSSAWALVYLMLEGMFRELGGPGFVVGNHVTIRTADGTYALVAHLRRGSVRVTRGDVVRAGERVGSCGNSGNSSEPHVHAQLMDRRSLWTAAGVPMAFLGVTVGDSDEATTGMPENEQHLVAATPSPDRHRA